ncbi:uncharacterized protein [Nicotiana tomentosiformis]|uniref:uncharacterized protein n=1 Tax=Nicotiana tomentosiformis TaxID=4098 RepID=UPI00388CD501
MIRQKVAGTFEFDEMSAMQAEIAKLTNQVAKIAVGQGHQMHQLGTDNQQLRLDNQQLKTDLRNLERQFEQVASNQNVKPARAFPSDTEKNPIKHMQVINLRSRRELEEPPSQKSIFERELVPNPVKKAEKKDDKQRQEINARLPPPFPQRLQKQKDEAKYRKFIDILSQVRVNLPLVEVLQEVPKYAKYLRDIMANKRRNAKFERVALTECSARVQSKLPPKLKDLGCFTIPLANEKHEIDEEVPVILGLPFLATGGETIYVREGKMKMRVHDEEVTFNVYKALKLPKHYEDL